MFVVQLLAPRKRRYIVADKRTPKKKSPKKKNTKESKSINSETIIIEEPELKRLFDHTLERAREITKKYKLDED